MDNLQCLSIYEDLVGFALQELDQQSDYVRATVDVRVHGDVVRQVAYFPHNETVVSCSQDPSATLVIRHVAARRTPYIFRLARVSVTLSRNSQFESQLVLFNVYCSFPHFLFENTRLVLKTDQVPLISR